MGTRDAMVVEYWLNASFNSNVVKQCCARAQSHVGINKEIKEFRMPGQKLDDIDRMILAELQADGRMTNVELAKRVGISAPPCLRRVRTLEEAGFIRGYHADVNPRELGFEVQVFAMVGLVSQAEVDLSAFESKCQSWPLVRECHMLNGEVDFVLKCVAPDLRTFQRFLTEELTSAPNVASVKTSLVIRGAKDEPGVPFDVLEARLAQQA
jgi:DNA-binding Lrp family transcriptional regulator